MLQLRALEAASHLYFLEHFDLVADLDVERANRAILEDLALEHVFGLGTRGGVGSRFVVQQGHATGIDQRHGDLGEQQGGVEVVGGVQTSLGTIDRAMDTYRALGMHPLHVRKEIDAFIADRLLESVWREALWLVNDGIATTEEIDDAIRFGFGLRWAQMGTFETYRIAGGEGGMRHFMAQFGPALKWPWTKLMDTPELTDELIDTIADQSDAQAGDRSIRDLAQERDRNLVAILSALESVGAGAGQTLAQLRELQQPS